MEDLDFDETDGCLVIKDAALADAITRAMQDPAHQFCITREAEIGPKINLMCPC